MFSDYFEKGARCSSVVEHLLMVQWFFGSIPYGGPIELFFIPAKCSTKGCGMCYPVCVMVHIKEPLLLIRTSNPYGGSGFPLSLSEWSFTIRPTLYHSK